MHFEQCSMHHEFKREIFKSHLTLPLCKFNTSFIRFGLNHMSCKNPSPPSVGDCQAEVTQKHVLHYYIVNTSPSLFPFTPCSPPPPPHPPSLFIMSLQFCTFFLCQTEKRYWQNVRETSQILRYGVTEVFAMSSISLNDVGHYKQALDKISLVFQVFYHKLLDVSIHAQAHFVLHSYSTEWIQTVQ